MSGLCADMYDPYRYVWDTETEERGIRFDETADCAEYSIWNDPDSKVILDCMPESNKGGAK